MVKALFHPDAGSTLVAEAERPDEFNACVEALLQSLPARAAS